MQSRQLCIDDDKGLNYFVLIHNWKGNKGSPEGLPCWLRFWAVECDEGLSVTLVVNSVDGLNNVAVVEGHLELSVWNTSKSHVEEQETIELHVFLVSLLMEEFNECMKYSCVPDIHPNGESTCCALLNESLRVTAADLDHASEACFDGVNHDEKIKLVYVAQPLNNTANIRLKIIRIQTFEGKKHDITWILTFGRYGNELDSVDWTILTETIRGYTGWVKRLSFWSQGRVHPVESPTQLYVISSICFWLHYHLGLFIQSGFPLWERLDLYTPPNTLYEHLQI